MEISREEEMTIKEMAKDKLIYQKFRDSIAPNIFGYDHVKDSIVLQLFGGVRKVGMDGNSVIRGDAHILLVGDPGVAKSAMLKYVSGIAPKARYVTGMGSSAAGLTATILKDDATKSYILEAGALPLTNKGLLAIDEIDKMNKDDRVAMHEALEQQTISISKANIHSTLSAQTSVLAAANPKMGRFNPYDVISSQIELPPTLINRFDLIFIMRDKPNENVDKLISERILEANKDINKNKPAIKTDLLKKYVAYAKQNCKPILSNDAIKAIQEFYLKLRRQNSSEGEELRPIPISARQLEAIIRLTEASAKVRLSEYATLDDAKRAIDLMMAYLGEVGIDKGTGELDIDRVITGIPSSQRSMIITIKSFIRSELDVMPKGSMLPITKVYDDAEKSGISADNVDQALTVLKKEGEIFEPKSGFIKLIN
jgi:replicative DNA helicase Mcm